jgi:hypothetical protein
MIKQRRVRHHPSSIYSVDREELVLIPLAPHHEEIDSADGLHNLSPEAYYLWIEEMHERALEEGEVVYWDI